MSEVMETLLEPQAQSDAIPPVLLLGQFERVGSTFYLDQLEKTNIVHNEPYKLLVPDAWPIARDYAGPLQDVDEFFENPSVPELDKHWLRNFALSLHQPGGQVVKETNLYLALPNFLSLFPGSRIDLLTRNPLGIISSFKRNNLFERWNYSGVASTVNLQLEEGKPGNFESMRHMLDPDKPWQARLAWMIGLNSVLLSRFVDVDRVANVVSYEEDIVPMGAQESLADIRSESSIFSTNVRKTHDDFESRLTDEEMAIAGQAMAECVQFVSQEFDESDTTLFEALYSRHLGAEKGRKGRPKTVSALGEVSTATESFVQVPVDSPEMPGKNKKHPEHLVRLDNSQNVLWSYGLVTNREMGTFFQDMLEEGFDPQYNHFLFMDGMPPSRGGRINFDPEAHHFLKTEGFDEHPAYWVSWLAAALFAYKKGMQLPSYTEWQDCFSETAQSKSANTANHSYAFDDVTPTGQGEAPVPDDFFGNLKIWCRDWSSEYAVSKKVAGISWKNYLHNEYNPEGERPFLTNSRIIGIRLTCCAECGPGQERSTSEVLAKFDEMKDIIEKNPVESSEDLSRINRATSELMTGQYCNHKDGQGLSE